MAWLRPAAVLLLAIGILAAPQTAATAAEGEPEQAASFIRNLGNTAIRELGDESVSQKTREQRFRKLLHDGFAIDAISRFVLGRYWRAASDEQQTTFRDTFQKVITQRFLPLFSGYSRDDFVVDGARADPRNPELYLVETRISQPGNKQAEKVKVAWRVRPADGAWEIVDVLAEGVSMAITLRSEYNSVIQRHGGDVGALIAMLQDNLAKGAYAPESVEGVVQ